MSNVLNFPEYLNNDIKSFLTGIFNSFTNTYPEQIVSYYLTGSRAAGHESTTSDYDLTFVVKDKKDPERHITFEEFQNMQLTIADIRKTSKYPLDVTIIGEQNIKYGDVMACTKQRVLLYGIDVLKTVKTLKGVKLQLIFSKVVLHNMKVLRGMDVLNYPLLYPNEQDEYYGYTKSGIWNADGSYREGLDVLVCLITVIASLRLSIFSDVQSTGKHYTATHYRRLLPNDIWTDLIEDVYNVCKVTYQSELPTDKVNMEKVKLLCKRTLEMENQFLQMLTSNSQFWIDDTDTNTDTKHLIKYIVNSINTDQPLFNELKLKYGS